MTQTSLKHLYTFEEYLIYDDGTENRYELVDGELLLMPPATGKHEAIITLLLIRFYLEIQRLGLDWQVRPSGTGVRTATKKSRLPDLCVITAQQRQEIETSAAVLESIPLLIVEVVSPESVKRDYEQKKDEYQAKKIPEYWIVDPLTDKVLVLLLVNNRYEATEFTANQQIISFTFPKLVLTAKQVFQA